MLENLTVIGTAMANRLEVTSQFKVAKKQKEERMKTPRECMTILTKCLLSYRDLLLKMWISKISKISSV